VLLGSRVHGPGTPEMGSRTRTYCRRERVMYYDRGRFSEPLRGFGAGSRRAAARAAYMQDRSDPAPALLQQKDKQIPIPLLQCAVPAASADGQRRGSWDAESGLVVSTDWDYSAQRGAEAKSPSTLHIHSSDLGIGR
jgi:hypothetical protein